MNEEHRGKHAIKRAWMHSGIWLGLCAFAWWTETSPAWISPAVALGLAALGAWSTVADYRENKDNSKGFETWF